MQNSKAKALIGIGLAVGLIAGPATVASASALKVLGSGAETGGVTIIDPGAGVSGETRDYSTHGDGGGGSFWQWGVGRDDTWSNYFREKRCHGATAVGKKSKRVSNVPGGKYAMAMTPKASSGNKAYYHNC